MTTLNDFFNDNNRQIPRDLGNHWELINRFESVESDHSDSKYSTILRDIERMRILRALRSNTYKSYDDQDLY
jgi:hypothetical protein